MGRDFHPDLETSRKSAQALFGHISTGTGERLIMGNTDARMVRLLSLLRAHRYWPGSELAQRLGVSERTLRRDIERLRELGCHIGASRGVAGGYQLRSDTALPLLLLEDDEAVVIAAGLRAAAGSGVSGVEETALRTLTKVVDVLPPRLRERIDAVGLTVVARACRNARRLRFRYTAHNGEQTNRLVEPHHLVPLGQRWYLVAFDLDRDDWRTFRVDRMAGGETSGTGFHHRVLPAEDATTYVRERLRSVPARHEVLITVRLPAAEVEKTVGHDHGTVAAVDQTTCKLSMHVNEFEWLVPVLAALRAEFHVDHPPEFRDYLRDAGQLLLRGAAAAG